MGPRRDFQEALYGTSYMNSLRGVITGHTVEDRNWLGRASAGTTLNAKVAMQLQHSDRKPVVATIGYVVMIRDAAACNATALPPKVRETIFC